MQDLNSNQPSLSVIAIIVGFLGVALLGAIPVQAQTLIMPGESIVLNTADQAPVCSGQDSGAPVTRDCQTNGRHLDVVVVSGISADELLDPQTGSAIATLSNEILIPDSTTGSQVLPVQIATEVSWSGALIVGGFNNTFAQVIADAAGQGYDDRPGGGERHVPVRSAPTRPSPWMCSRSAAGPESPTAPGRTSRRFWCGGGHTRSRSRPSAIWRCLC